MLSIQSNLGRTNPSQTNPPSNQGQSPDRSQGSNKLLELAPGVKERSQVNVEAEQERPNGKQVRRYLSTLACGSCPTERQTEQRKRMNLMVLHSSLPSLDAYWSYATKTARISQNEPYAPG